MLINSDFKNKSVTIVVVLLNNLALKNNVEDINELEKK